MARNDRGTDWPTLRTHPSVWVKLACSKCGRRGRYRLVTLVERFGADARMVTVRERLSADCPYNFGHATPKLPAGCQARFVEGNGPPNPAPAP
ncbi:MAG: hypothetical protein AB1592_11460 [Pseudomonadota bacterium]